MRVGGLRVPKIGHGLPTDTRGKYADTTVSPSVSKAARHIIAHCARASGVQSTHGAAHVGNDGLLPESRGVHCYSMRGGDGAAGQRSSFACQKGCSPTLTARLPLCVVTDSRYCAGKVAHD
jgi:hypothetical protein